MLSHNPCSASRVPAELANAAKSFNARVIAAMGASLILFLLVFIVFFTVIFHRGIAFVVFVFSADHSDLHLVKQALELVSCLSEIFGCQRLVQL